MIEKFNLEISQAYLTLKLCMYWVSIESDGTTKTAGVLFCFLFSAVNREAANCRRISRYQMGTGHSGWILSPPTSSSP